METASEQKVEATNSVNEAKRAIAALRTLAVSGAMYEIMTENRAEIVKRARAKLKAMGGGDFPENEINEALTGIKS